MKMTEELASRIVDRARTLPFKLPDAQKTELLMDWLEGQTGKELQAKFNISRSQVRNIINQARADAAKVLEAKK